MRFRENIVNMKPYSVPERLPPIRLDKNESPFDVPMCIKKKVFEHFQTNPFNRYPEIDSMMLREALAADMGVDASQVFISSGADALIPEIIDLFEGEQVITFQPTFSMYDFYTLRRGLRMKELELDENFAIPNDFAPDLERDCLVIICSPNNPTGNDMASEKIRDILETGIPVLLDQAYVEFSDNDYLGLLKEYDNLIILRTFSKAFGMSGLRVGYAITSEKIAKHLSKAHSPFALNSFSCQMALEMLKNKELIKERIDFIKAQRDSMQDEFKTLSRVNSSANFILLKTDAFDFLFERGIAVRKFKGKMNEYVRITLGTQEENEVVKKLLKEFETKDHSWIH